MKKEDKQESPANSDQKQKQKEKPKNPPCETCKKVQITLRINAILGQMPLINPQSRNKKERCLSIHQAETPKTTLTVIALKNTKDFKLLGPRLQSATASDTAEMKPKTSLPTIPEIDWQQSQDTSRKDPPLF